jgi:hypothetical protein
VQADPACTAVFPQQNVRPPYTVGGKKLQAGLPAYISSAAQKPSRLTNGSLSHMRSLRVYGGGSARESHPVVFSRTEAFEPLCALEALFYLFIIL